MVSDGPAVPAPRFLGNRRFVGRFGQGLPKVRLVALGILALGVGVFLFASLATLAGALAVCLGLGAAVACVLVASQTLMQQETPTTMLGRVSSTAASVVTVAQLAAVAGAGTLAGLLGIRRLFYLVALVLTLTGGLGYAYSRARRIAEAGQGGPET